jgi:hypothetical protein
MTAAASDQTERREAVRRLLLARVARADGGRQEALREFVGVTRPDLGPEAAGIIAAKAPPVPLALTEKWIGLFVDRLFETVPAGQIELLCDGSQDNEAALVLAYVMFLESERMERQMAEDLASLGAAQAGQDDALTAEVSRELCLAGERRRTENLRKAAAYQARQGRPN